MTYSDDQLIAYLDGAISAADAEAIEAAIEADPAFEARLMALDPLAAPVQAAFTGVPAAARLDGMIPERVAANDPRPPRRALWVACIGVLAGIVLGAMGLSVLSPEPPAPQLGWRAQVALYQALYTPETIEHLDAEPAYLAEQFARAAEALGRDLDPASVAELDGLELRRAQVLAFGDRTLVQIVFATETGEPVAFCIIEGGAAEAQPAAFEQLAGLQTAHWAGGGFGFMVLGDIDDAQLRAVTDELTARF